MIEDGVAFGFLSTTAGGRKRGDQSRLWATSCRSALDVGLFDHMRPFVADRMDADRSNEPWVANLWVEWGTYDRRQSHPSVFQLCPRRLRRGVGTALSASDAGHVARRGSRKKRPIDAALRRRRKKRNTLRHRRRR